MYVFEGTTGLLAGLEAETEVASVADELRLVTTLG